MFSSHLAVRTLSLLTLFVLFLVPAGCLRASEKANSEKANPGKSDFLLRLKPREVPVRYKKSERLESSRHKQGKSANWNKYDSIDFLTVVFEPAGENVAEIAQVEERRMGVGDQKIATDRKLPESRKTLFTPRRQLVSLPPADDETVSFPLIFPENPLMLGDTWTTTATANKKLPEDIPLTHRLLAVTQVGGHQVAIIRTDAVSVARDQRTKIRLKLIYKAKRQVNLDDGMILEERSNLFLEYVMPKPVAEGIDVLAHKVRTILEVVSTTGGE